VGRAKRGREGGSQVGRSRHFLACNKPRIKANVLTSIIIRYVAKTRELMNRCINETLARYY